MISDPAMVHALNSTVHQRGAEENLCLICWKPKPACGWYETGEGDEGTEYFCSEACFEENRK